MSRAAWVGTIALAVVVVLFGCETKKQEPKEQNAEKAATEASVTPTGTELGGEASAATETPTAQPTPEEPKAPEVVLATVTPTPAPAEWPKYEKVEEIPQDSFVDIMTKNEQGRPSVFTLKNDVVFQSFPCAAGERISVYVNADAIAGCTLGLDTTVVAGIDLAKGTEIKTQPDGSFTGFVLEAPQLVAGVPVRENDTVYWTASSGLGTVTLATDANVLGIDFKAGTSLTFRSNAKMKSLQSAQLVGDHTIAGQAYIDGQRLELDENNAVVPAAP